MASSGRIAKNTTYLTIASIAQKLISFAYYGYLAKAIGEASLGKYTFALAFTSIFIIFMDFGLGPLLTREGSKDETKLQQHFQTMFSIKIFLIILALIALFPSIHIAAYFFDQIDQTDLYLVYIGALIILFDTVTFTFFSIFRALKKLHWEAIGIVIYQSAILIAGIAALRAGLSIYYILAALLVGSIVQFCYLFIVLKLKTDIKFKFRISWSQAKKVLALSAPFAIAGFIFRLNGTADNVMLKIFVGDSFAGWYALAFKLTFALTVLPGAFATSYFPAVSHYYKHMKDELHKVFESGIFYMLLLSFPIVGGVLVLGDNVILTVWGQDWEASIMPLRILMLALPFVFLNYPVGNFLNAVDKQRLNTLNMCIALVVNIVLNAFLIPYYTFNGAAIAAVTSSVVLVCLGVPWVYKTARFQLLFIVKKVLLIGLAAGVMSFILYFIQYNYELYLLIPIGAIIYFAVLLILNGVTNEELKSLKAAIIKPD